MTTPAPTQDPLETLIAACENLTMSLKYDRRDRETRPLYILQAEDLVSFNRAIFNARQAATVVEQTKLL